MFNKMIEIEIEKIQKIIKEDEEFLDTIHKNNIDVVTIIKNKKINTNGIKK